MLSSAWRIILVENHAVLSYGEGQMRITTAEGVGQIIPLFDVRAVLIVSLQVRLSAYLINELHKRHISLIFCDQGARPYGEMVGYHDNCWTPRRLKEQFRWKRKNCRLAWNGIIRQKIQMQGLLLKQLEKKYDSDLWNAYLSGINSVDKSNREGQAARLYFNALFSVKFNRRKPSPVNAGLNYGYAILCSITSRIITAYGYSPSLGIAHHNAANPFNFSYDILEPFRPFVDSIVYHRQESLLDKEYKKELIGLSNIKMRYGEKRMHLSSAVECFFRDVIKTIESGDNEMKEIGF